jgi:hypothetical protein
VYKRGHGSGAGLCWGFAVADDGGEGVRGGGGDDGVDADLVLAAVVEDLEVEGLVELLLEAGRRGGEDVAQVGEGVQQGGVLARGGDSECVELGVDVGALVFQFGEPVDEPGP